MKAFEVKINTDNIGYTETYVAPNINTLMKHLLSLNITDDEIVSISRIERVICLKEKEQCKKG